MSWEETSPGRFERPLDTVELLFKTIADAGAPLQREHWAVRVFARFSLDHSSGDAEHTLRHAWKTMRYDHPQIASYAEGKTKVYEVPTNSTVDSWLAKTFHVVVSITADDLVEKLQPCPMSTIYFLPHTSEIVICASHWQIDGIGALGLLHNFFEAVAQPRHLEFGTEGKNLSPGLNEAAGFPTSVTEEDERAASKLLNQYIGNLPSIGLPANFNNPVLGATRRAMLVLSPVTTSKIVRACKIHDFSVTTALHAALVLATKQMDMSRPQTQRYTSWASFSLRPYLTSPYNILSSHPVSAYLVGFPLTIIPSTFTEHASQLRSFYKQLSSPTSNTNFLTYVKAYISQCTYFFGQSPSAATPMPTEPMLDSVGVADRYLKSTYGGTVEVTDFWLGSETLTAQLTSYVWTWQGKMTFNVCYNEHFYEAELVMDFLNRLVNILLEELGLMDSISVLDCDR